MFAKGYKASAVRTGFEAVVAHRVDDIFAYTAKGDGQVVSLTADSIVVEYKDGSKRSVQLGRRFGTVGGTVFPHQLNTNLKAGDRIKDGDIVAFNSNYFQPDFLNPKQVALKVGIDAKVAVFECSDTLEDSCIISERIAGEMATRITQVRDVVLTFDQSARNLVHEGQVLDSEDILCTIEDAVTADQDLFDEESLKTLKLLGGQTPRSKYRGVVEKIEIFYNGDKEDMSPTLRTIADQGDKARAKLAKNLGRPVMSGSVDSNLRIDGNPLNMDSLVIRVYITVEMAAGVGDKGVFANQLKTIIGSVMSGVNRTKSGVEIDAIFGYQSISDRIVLSPELIGTTTTLLKVLGKQAAELYYS